MKYHEDDYIHDGGDECEDDTDPADEQRAELTKCDEGQCDR